MAKHYSLKVLRAEGVAWNAGLRHLYDPNPSLYVEIGLGDITQKTETIKSDIAPEWGETLPLICKPGLTSVSIKLKHKSRIKRDLNIGCAGLNLAEPPGNYKPGEIILPLLPPDSLQDDKPNATIFLHLETTNAKVNAELALHNLVRVLNHGSSTTSTPVEDILNEAEMLVKGGKDAMKANSDLVQAFEDAIPGINNFVATMDKITDANAYLKLAWCTASALYKIISVQVEDDNKFRSLVMTLVKLFDCVKEVKHRRHILPSTQSIISKILETITECCLLMRKHARHSFAGRYLSVSDKAKISRMEKSLNDLKMDLTDAFTLQKDIQDEASKLFEKLNVGKTDDVDASKRSACFKGTQSSILSDIKTWVSSDSRRNILWLNGVAGSGKSTIATTIAKELRTSSLGAYLLFERGKSNPNRIFRTIACRLAKTNLVLASYIVNTCKDIDTDSNTAEEDFEILFKNVLRSTAADLVDPVLIILDGLEECGSSVERSNLMRWLKNDFSKLPSKFRFFITSRPEDDIVQALSSKPHVREVRLNHHSKSSRQDVKSYLRYSLRNMIKAQGSKDWNWEKALEILSEAANGLFIWASTLVKLISEKTFRFEYLNNLVMNPKSLSLHDLYDKALAGALQWDEATASIFSKIMALVLFGNMQLSDKTIDGLLGLAPLRGSANILSKLQSLIAYESGKPTRLHHASFYDYMTSTDCRGKPWFIDIASQKKMIVSSCFNVMASSLRFNICGLKSSFLRNDAVKGLGDRIKKNIPQHLVYACRFWAQHLREVDFSDDLLKQLTTFAYVNILSWFEVLSLTKNFYHQVGQALQIAIEWIENKKPDLSRFLMQAIRLASTFAIPIAESTPHIYVSMLPLTEESDVSAHYMRKTPPLSLVSVRRNGVKQMSSLLKVFEDLEHIDEFTCVEFSPDGKRVVSGSLDKTVRVWDLESGKIVAGPFKGHTKGVVSVRFSPDGKHIVSGSRDKTVRVWDMKGGVSVVNTPEGHTEEVTSVEVSPDGKCIASGYCDGAIQVWDIESRKVVASILKGHTKRITSIRFSSDGKRIVSGSHDKLVRVWDIKGGKVVAGPFEGHSDIVTSVGFSPNGKHVVSGSSDKTVRVWGVKGGKVVVGTLIRHTKVVTSVGFSPDGKRVVSCSRDKTVYVWDLEGGEIVAGPFEGHTSRVTSAVFSPDGKRVVSGSLDSTVRVWDVEGGVFVVNTPKGHTEEVTSVGISPDGKRVVSGHCDGMVQLWDVERAKVIAGPFKKHEYRVNSVGFSHDGKRVVSGSNDKTVRVWNLKGYKNDSSVFKGHTAPVTSAVFSPDGNYVASGSEDKTVRVWDLKDGKVVAGPFKGHTDNIISIGFSPNGKYVISGSRDTTMLVWSIKGAKDVVGPFKGHTSTVTSVGFSHSGKHVISGSYDKTVRVWDLSSVKVIAGPFKGHADKVTTVGFSLDGKRAISASRDNTIGVWDLSKSRMPISDSSDNQTNSVFSGTLSQNGKYVVSTSQSGDIRVSNVLLVDGHSKLPGIFSNWTMSEDSWICSKEGNLLLWIPPDIRPSLWHPHTLKVFNCPFSTRLDFKYYNSDGKWTR